MDAILGFYQFSCLFELVFLADHKGNSHAIVVPEFKAPPLPERSCSVTVPEVVGVQFSVTGLPAEMEL